MPGPTRHILLTVNQTKQPPRELTRQCPSGQLACRSGPSSGHSLWSGRGYRPAGRSRAQTLHVKRQWHWFCGGSTDVSEGWVSQGGLACVVSWPVSFFTGGMLHVGAAQHCMCMQVRWQAWRTALKQMCRRSTPGLLTSSAAAEGTLGLNCLGRRKRGHVLQAHPAAGQTAVLLARLVPPRGCLTCGWCLSSGGGWRGLHSSHVNTQQQQTYPGKTAQAELMANALTWPDTSVAGSLCRQPRVQQCSKAEPMG